MSKCRECGKAVSTLAKTCPSCGVPKPAKVLKQKISTKKTITKSKKEKPNVSSTKKTSTEEYVYNPNTGSYDKGSKKIKKDSSYDFKTGYNPKTGSFERESNKNKITKPSNEINEEEQRRRKEELKQNNQYWKDQEIIRKQTELLALENKQRRQREEEQERREQRQRTARQEAINYQEEAAKKKPSPGSSGHADYTNNQNKVETKSGEGNVFDKFADGHLDLATAFWGFGVFGSIIVGVVCGVLSEVVGIFFNWVYFVVTLMIIQWLWSCAENHKKIMTQKKQPSVWGGLTQAYCVLSGLGLAAFVFELF